MWQLFKHPLNLTPLILLSAVLLLGTACERTSTTQPITPVVPGDSLELLREVLADPAECAGCHPNHYQEWRESMHAYAMKDPIFLALQEIGQQRSNRELDQFCTKCHSPLGSRLGETPPGFDPAELSPLAANGIHCDVCHTMKSFERGRSIKTFHLDRVRRSTIADPRPNPYHPSAFDNAYNFSGICSPCHDIRSPDMSFNLEETSLEWDESPFLGMGVECQDCHMPSYSGRAASGGPQRDDLNHHWFVGVDYPLIDFPGKQQTIARVAELLQNAVTMTVDAPGQVAAGKDFTVNVRIKNDKTGHNIPSGAIFERQMWIELLVKDARSGAVYLESGLLDENGDLKNHHSEAVAGGIAEEDTLLTLFNGIPRDGQGREVLFFWEALSVRKNTIEAFKSHTTNYPMKAPSQATTLKLAVRLRFRSFPPYVFREIGKEELIPELIVFDMETAEQTIEVAN